MAMQAPAVMIHSMEIIASKVDECTVHGMTLHTCFRVAYSYGQKPRPHGVTSVWLCVKEGDSICGEPLYHDDVSVAASEFYKAMDDFAEDFMRLNFGEGV